MGLEKESVGPYIPETKYTIFPKSLIGQAVSVSLLPVPGGSTFLYPPNPSFHTTDLPGQTA